MGIGACKALDLKGARQRRGSSCRHFWQRPETGSFCKGAIAACNSEKFRDIFNIFQHVSTRCVDIFQPTWLLVTFCTRASLCQQWHQPQLSVHPLQPQLNSSKSHCLHMVSSMQYIITTIFQIMYRIENNKLKTSEKQNTTCCLFCQFKTYLFVFCTFGSFGDKLRQPLPHP